MKRFQLTNPHSNPAIDTVSKFLDAKDSIASFYKAKPRDFLYFSDEESDKRNIDFIFEQYTDEQKKKFPTPESITSSAPFNLNTVVMVETDYVNNDLTFIKGRNLFLKQKDFKTFVDSEFLKIQNDPNFIRESRTLGANILELSCQVWIYVRSLDTIFDLTKYVSNLTTNKGSGEGSFNMSLATFNQVEGDVYTLGEDIINYFSPIVKIDENYVINDTWVHKYLQQNDIVFIRFEKLVSDKRKPDDQVIISNNQLYGQNWDMIGLVDNVPQNHSSGTDNVSVTINGRDFTKLLTEDGSYFYPYALIKGSGDFFINAGQDNRYFKRAFVDSKFKTLFAYTYRGIKDTLGFIFNQLTNVGVLPPNNSLFSSYGSDISKTYEVSGADASVLREVEQVGVWKIIKVLVDSQLDDRRISDSSIATPDGSLLDQINKACQMPFVEFWGDTYGSFFNFIVRQPPFTKSQILDFISDKYTVQVSIDDVSDYSVDWETEYYSIYQIQASNSFLGNANFVALSHVPVVYFSEYINNFGNHKLTVPTNYISYNALFGKDKSKNADLFRNAIVNDFKYLIESHFYLPFTRKGSFTIKGGDRRIKRGTWIKLLFTNEIAYVDSVNNNLSASESDISRDTIIQFSRAMKIENINGVGINYFDIVNVDVISDLISTGISGKKIDKSKTDLILNSEAFDYFLKRKQM